MSFFNALYTLGNCRRTQPIQDNSQIAVDFDSQNTCAKATRWAKWIVTLPISLAHGAFNTAYMLATKDINKVVSSQIYKGNSINCMQFLVGKTGHVITSHKVAKAVTSHYRHDDRGPFERENKDTFIPILQDLYPKESVNKEDFLFTCSHENVKAFRDPILDYVGPRALPQLRPQIDLVSKEVVEAMAGRETISARVLAETYTVAILARLFLNHPGTLDDFQKIGGAASSVAEYQMIKKWAKPNGAQSARYAQALQILKNAIASSSGNFIDSMRASGLSPIQINAELLLVYVAGSETTSSALQYILWRLGQDPNLQDTIRSKSESLAKFINDCMLEYTPLAFFSRWARQDLVISVKNSRGGSWKYPIAKGEALIMAPHLAKNFTFGGGVHTCPGQWLARAEISSLVSMLLMHHNVISFPRKKELSTLPGLGFLKVEPVDLTLRKR